MAEPLVDLAVVSSVWFMCFLQFICFLAVRMLQFKTWWRKDIRLLPGSSSKPWTKAILF